MKPFGMLDAGMQQITQAGLKPLTELGSGAFTRPSRRLAHAAVSRCITICTGKHRTLSSIQASMLAASLHMVGFLWAFFCWPDQTG